MQTAASGIIDQALQGTKTVSAKGLSNARVDGAAAEKPTGSNEDKSEAKPCPKLVRSGSVRESGRVSFYHDR
jgi:hypothetical protein